VEELLESEYDVDKLDEELIEKDELLDNEELEDMHELVHEDDEEDVLSEKEDDVE
jgi:hypothetical protein